jgi:hypothetical protein
MDFEVGPEILQRHDHFPDISRPGARRFEFGRVAAGHVVGGRAHIVQQHHAVIVHHGLAIGEVAERVFEVMHAVDEGRLRPDRIALQEIRGEEIVARHLEEMHLPRIAEACVLELEDRVYRDEIARYSRQ